ncbi:MAG: hypothetical protein R3F11_28635 [Verrucomicrobiales bacterium]
MKFTDSPDEAGELLLDFAISGQPISIQQGGEVVFFYQLPAGPGMGDQTGGTGNGGTDDNGGATLGQSAGSLAPAPGLSVEAEGAVEVQFGIAGPVGLEIEVEAIPAGDYSVIIDGVERAIMVVALDGNKNRGKVRFETVPSDADELPLDFLAVGLPVAIMQDGQIFFSGTVPTAAL